MNVNRTRALVEAGQDEVCEIHEQDGEERPAAFAIRMMGTTFNPHLVSFQCAVHASDFLIHLAEQGKPADQFEITLIRREHPNQYDIQDFEKDRRK